MNQLKAFSNIFQYILLVCGIPIVLHYYLELNKKITLVTLSVVLVSIFIFINLTKTNPKKNLLQLNKYILIFILFLTTIITQGVNLNFETLDWDIHSYLVVAMDIDRGFIPLENQWESKGPLLFYMYNFIYKVALKNFVYFKILNDLLLFFISLFLFFSIYNNDRLKITPAFSSALLFIILMGQTFAQAEYSEIYSLLFISSAYYLLSSKELNKTNIFFISMLLSFSTLVNQGTVLFIFGFLFYLLLIKQDFLRKNFKILITGMGLPHLFFLFIYINKDLFFIYKSTYIEIPLGYTSASLSSVRELVVFLRSYYEYDILTFTTLISLFTIFTIFIIIKKNSLFTDRFLQFILINIFISLLFYFVGSHNYYHHLFFLIYFVCFIPALFQNNNIKFFVFILVLVASFSMNIKTFDKSFNNLINANILLEDYPMYQASQMIKNSFEKQPTILALDYVAVLHYLNLPNFSYVVHPSNHFEPYITNTLINADKIESDEVNKAILRGPDVILCSGTKIISGKVEKETNFNCAISDWNKNYKEIDTRKYKENKNLSFYYDPYRPIGIYFKTSKKNEES